jgi:hypothetical protein
VRGLPGPNWLGTGKRPLWTLSLQEPHPERVLYPTPLVLLDDHGCLGTPVSSQGTFWAEASPVHPLLKTQAWIIGSAKTETTTGLEARRLHCP